jgi:hypothetical protein
MAIREIEPAHWVGDSEGLMLLPTVDEVLRRLAGKGIHLLDYEITVTGVYTRSAAAARPYGFDFECGKVTELLGIVSAMSARKLPTGAFDFDLDKTEPTFNEDRRDTLEGKFSAGQTKGRGFRQVGTGDVLHIEIALSGQCNVHIDSHGYVTAPGEYDWGRLAPLHGYWDLLSDYAPGLFAGFGEHGQVGLMARPIQGLDGETRWYFGLTGRW